MVYLWLVLGLALTLYGANILTDGASALAKRLGVSEFVIGLTVVAIGTSMPELVIGVMSAARGNGDVAIGNILGSNVINVLFILGITAVIKPVSLTEGNVRRDIPFGFLAALILFFCCSDRLLDGAGEDVLSRSEGLVMLGFFAVFMFYSFSIAGENTGGGEPAKSEAAPAKTGTGKSLLMIGVGLAGLVVGGDLFLNNSVRLARSWGMSESVIAVTLMAGGTSLPELSSALVAALKNKPGLALGNILGSNVLNVFLILGLSAAVRPLAVGGIAPEDFAVLLLSMLLLFIVAFTFRGRRIDRKEGVFFVVIYILYVVRLLLR